MNAKLNFGMVEKHTIQNFVPYSMSVFEPIRFSINKESRK